MKAYLINMYLLVPRSRSNIKVTFLKKWPFWGHSCFTNTSCFFKEMVYNSIYVIHYITGYKQSPLLFSSPEHEVLRVSYCDHSQSVRRLSVVFSHFLVYTLASTNINQSAPNLIKLYMTIRSHMSFIMELIGPELSEFSALELENLPYLTLFTL